jgi:hypothetical protein
MPTPFYTNVGITAKSLGFPKWNSSTSIVPKAIWLWQSGGILAEIMLEPPTDNVILPADFVSLATFGTVAVAGDESSVVCDGYWNRSTHAPNPPKMTA